MEDLIRAWAKLPAYQRKIAIESIEKAATIRRQFMGACLTRPEHLEALADTAAALDHVARMLEAAPVYASGLERADNGADL